jgi:quercetin dioxygenase-like cupin family protein
MEPTVKRIVFVTLLVLMPMVASAVASDLAYYNSLNPEWLQDYCVADRTSHIWVDGHVKCKNQTHVRVADFVYHGFMNNTPGETNNPDGVSVTPCLVAQLPSLNGQNLGLARADFAPAGVVVPHFHPRASEVLILLTGSLYLGFVNSTNHLFTTTIVAGDLFVFPRGLIHFQMNVAPTQALAISVFNSQNPGIAQVGRGMFGSSPLIDDLVLMKAFKISQHNVEFCENNFNTTTG